MFKKIDINRFGLFTDYEWSRNIGNDTNIGVFKKLNIIYGRNYSGKTTISRIFKCIEDGKLHNNYPNGNFTITDVDNKLISHNSLNTDFKIRVYNTDFVKENLSWLHDDINGEIKPFTLLGSGNLLASQRIIEIDQILGNIEDKIGLYYDFEQQKENYKKEFGFLEDKKSSLSSKLTFKANQEIKRSHFYVKQGATYNVNNIQKEIDEIISSGKFKKLDEKEIDNLKSIINETEKTKIDEIHITKLKLQEHIKTVKELVEKKITLTDTIQELVNEAILQDWVDKGRGLHKGKRDKCAFCGSLINDKRWEILDAHFSKESEDLKKEIEVEIESIQKSKDSISNFLISKNYISNSFYSTLLTDFELIKSDWEILILDYQNSLKLLKDNLTERYNDIFNPKNFSEVNDNSELVIQHLSKFNNLAIRNEELTLSLEKEKEGARKQLRFSEILNFIDSIDYIKATANIKEDDSKLLILSDKKDEISNKILELEKEKKLKELELNDEGEAAKKVNSHLSNFFGHKGLTLEPEITNDSSPKTKFVINRESEKAKNLSEGESSLISFCYFIAKMEDELKGAECNKLIIYIDDPISSLDNNHIFFMYSLIESVIAKEKKYCQLFISTHNLDFLKYIKRLTIPFDEGNKELINHFIVEKRKKGSESKCILLPMPNHLKEYITEYNFLFKEIFNMAKTYNNGSRSMSIENSFTNFYNLPNNMRKFLECYLFYRFPNTDNPLIHINKLFDNNVPCLINRVVNEYSHLTWGDRGTIVMDVEEAESVASEIIKTLINKDYDHYLALCLSVNVDPNLITILPSINIPTVEIENNAIEN